MTKKKVLDWFLTNRGRQFSLVCAGGVTTATIMGHLLPNTVFTFKYRDIVRLYRKGFSVPVPQTIQDRFKKTLELLEVEKDGKLDFSPFMAGGFDVYSMGTYGRFGVHVAIPVNFTYQNIETIDKSRIKVNLEPVVWDSDAGKQLLKSLVLSENAQMYAMAREIKLRSTNKLFYDTFYAGASCFSTYAFSRFINQTYNLYSKPRPVRILAYAFVSLLTLGNYIMCKDTTQGYYEKKVDEELKEKSPIFAEGGKEFYSQILERNKALRVLMGKEGPKSYTVLGNENYYIRNKHIPLVQRKQFFEDKNISENEKSLKGNAELIA